MRETILLLATLAMLGCADDGDTGGITDTGIKDAPLVDAPLVDAPLIDAPLIDAPLVDAPLVDAPVKDAPLVDAPAKEASLPDLPLPEAAVDLPRLDKCVPYCHWDCFGGVTCSAGKVYEVIYSPVPCCTFSDPWPFPGPVCTYGKASRVCTTAKCVTPEKRYASCAQNSGLPYASPPAAHVTWLYCPASQAIKVGSTCASDAECRPAPVGTARLSCDKVKKTCQATTRPAAPASFGKGCGLTVSNYQYKSAKQDHLVVGPSCSTCHAIWDPAKSCVKQACTMACKYDEDCPTGTICLCPIYKGGKQYCAAATSRTNVAGRAAALKCP